MDLYLEKGNISELHSSVSPSFQIGEGDILLKVDKFVLTSNIVSYATSGDSLGYFKFFPMENGMRVPSWGFATVLVSRVDDIKIGDRFYGFFPMSKYLCMKPSAMGNDSFIDTAEHRKALPSIYNTYSLCSKSDFYRAEFEDLTILLRPLYLTGWLLADFVFDNKNFDAENVIITSASSKTSIGLAHELSTKKQYKSIGLTSTRNIEFVKGLNLYDQVMSYDEVGSLPPEATYTIIDMAGNRSLINTIQNRVEERLKYICAVGNTHWNSNKSKQEKQYAVKPKFFFAPTQSSKRVKEWGGAKLKAAIDSAWLNFVEVCSSRGWLTVSASYGVHEVKNTYKRLSNGEVEPIEALICSLWKSDTPARL